MLQQILSDMFIDPDLLAELDDEQKQTLFCKMREEQVRRWKLWQEQDEREGRSPVPHAPRKNKKSVKFLLGSDSEPWTWVMGEHIHDKTIDDIIDDEARERARTLAEKEAAAEQLSVVEAELVKTINEEEQLAPTKPPLPVKPVFLRGGGTVPFAVRNVRAEILSCSKNPDGQPDDEWVTSRLQIQRESQIYESIRETQRKADELSELVRKEQEDLWKEREKKAKEAERQIREIARQAREEHKKVNRNSSLVEVNCDNVVTSTLSVELADPAEKNVNFQKRGTAFAINNKNKNRPNKPPSKESIVEWFRKEELPQGAGVDPVYKLEVPWFHGMIGRVEAETLLLPASEGSFLVRLSERIWGYAISYRASDRCKHFLIDASGTQYQFFGSGHMAHNTLYDLVTYHKNRPITTCGQECLLYPCPRSAAVITHLKDLFEP